MHQISQDALMGLEGKENTGDLHFSVPQAETGWNMDSVIFVGLFQHGIFHDFMFQGWNMFWERSYEDKPWRGQLGWCRQMWRGRIPPFFRRDRDLWVSAGEEKYSLALNPWKVSGPWIRWPQNAFSISATTDIRLTWVCWEFFDRTTLFFYFFNRENLFV